MRFRTFASVMIGTSCAVLALSVHAQKPSKLEAGGTDVVAVKPNYLPPSSLVEFLGARQHEGKAMVEWTAPDGAHAVELRRNDAANLLILSGTSNDVATVEKLVRQADVPPRQIAIEAKIVEIDQSKMDDLGLDWAEIMRYGAPRMTWSTNHTDNKLNTKSHVNTEPAPSNVVTEETRWQDSRTKATAEGFSASSSVNLGSVLSILDETGAGTVRNAPRILTLNNKRATILDGQRVTYVARYSSYTNLFVTDSMDAGLTLNVLPSLGESGYITLQIRAEMTHLIGDVSGSPAKDGQMVENTVVVKDGETVLLGGFQRTTERTIKRRFPLLGYVLPFIFSHDSKVKSTTETFVVLTPRVVDFSVALDDSTNGIINGK